MSAGTKKKMLEIKRSKFSEIWLIPFAGVFVAIYISDFLNADLSLATSMNNDWGAPWGTLGYWGFFLVMLSVLSLSVKRLFSNDPVITMDTNEIKFYVPTKDSIFRSYKLKVDLTLQWKEIEKIQLGYASDHFEGGKTEHLVITPFNEEVAKKYNDIEDHKDVWPGVSWKITKRIGIEIKGLELKPKEILVQAKKFLAENS